MEDKRTMKELAQEALDVQNASNLSGIVFGWARSMKRFNELNPGIGTDARNRHPIHVLWASKMASLTRCENTLAFSDAYNETIRLATQD
jgi:hypothetical protein